MEWYNIVLLLLGGVGGTAGLISIYKAKAEKTGIDIGNMQDMLDEAHKMFNAACEEKDNIQREFSEYKAENMKYIGEFKARFAKVEQRLDKAENTIFDLTGAVYQGYRCKYPENIEDCPVIKEYEKKHCKKCVTKINE
jgi:spermidine/putrescine-binding protein